MGAQGEDPNPVIEKTLHEKLFESAGRLFITAGERDPGVLGKIVMFSMTTVAALTSSEYSEEEASYFILELGRKIDELRDLFSEEEQAQMAAIAERGVDTGV